MVGEVGLEPTKAKPADLQSAPFAARDTPPDDRKSCSFNRLPITGWRKSFARPYGSEREKASAGRVLGSGVYWSTGDKCKYYPHAGEQEKSPGRVRTWPTLDQGRQ